MIARRAQDDAVGQGEFRHQVPGSVAAFRIVRLVQGQLQRGTADEFGFRSGAFRGGEHVSHGSFGRGIGTQCAPYGNDVR